MQIEEQEEKIPKGIKGFPAGKGIVKKISDGHDKA